MYAWQDRLSLDRRDLLLSAELDDVLDRLHYMVPVMIFVVEFDLIVNLVMIWINPPRKKRKKLHERS